jgi:hypothetical protein
VVNLLVGRHTLRHGTLTDHIDLYQWPRKFRQRLQRTLGPRAHRASVAVFVNQQIRKWSPEEGIPFCLREGFPKAHPRTTGAVWALPENAGHGSWEPQAATPKAKATKTVNATNCFFMGEKFGQK